MNERTKEKTKNKMEQAGLFESARVKDFTPDQKLLALSWKQPFADLMLHGKIETRSWNTNYRGWVLICASKKEYSYKEEMEISGEENMYDIGKLLIGKEYKTGMAIAIGRLTNCVLWVNFLKHSISYEAGLLANNVTLTSEIKTFVKYNPNLYLHFYEDVRAIEPFEWKGTQGWKEVSYEIKEKIKFI